MNEYIQLANLFLNVLIIPLLGILWSIKIELTKVDARLTALVEEHSRRLSRLEYSHDRREEDHTSS